MQKLCTIICMVCGMFYTLQIERILNERILIVFNDC